MLFRSVTRGPDGTVRVTNRIDGALLRPHSTGVTFRASALDVASIRDDDPASAEATAEREVMLRFPDGPSVTVTGTLRLVADAGTWHLSGRLRAERDGISVADRPFAIAIPRRIP